MLVAPIIIHLLAVYQRADAVEAQLLRLLNQLRTWEQAAQGYGPANLITLLHELRGHLRNIDLRSAKRLQTLRRDRPYERLNITGIEGLTNAQKSTLQSLGAIEDMKRP
jgi:hypothetical protein